MKISEITEGKLQFLPLLLMADEQEDMIARYLDRGRMYAIHDNGLKCVCVATDDGQGMLEIKNIAVAPDCRRLGYGRTMLGFIEDTYRESHRILQVGTGDTPSTIRFYESCGFVRSHVVKGFFTDNYDHPIYEDGILLADMIYLRKRLLG